MSPKEKFEIIVAKIEELIRAPYEMSDREIAEKAFNEASEYIDDRSKNTVFSFLLQTTVIKYISERRLMEGYKVLLTEKDVSDAYKKAYQLSGCNTQQAYATKFKDFFGFPPTDAVKLNNMSLYKATPAWESLSNDGLKEEHMDNRKFGVPVEKFRIIQEALNLEAFYGLNDEESDFAFSLYDEKEIPLEECFHFVGSYLMQNKEADRDSRLKKDLDNEDVQYLFFKLGLSYDEIFNILLMQYLGEFRRSIQDYSEEFIRGCANYPIEELWSRNEHEIFEDIYKYYKDNVDAEYTMYDFCMFAFCMQYRTKEQALNSLKPGIPDLNHLNREKNKFENSELDRFYKYQDLYEYEHDYDEEDVYEPEVWDENYSSYRNDVDYDENDEEAWVLDALESKEIPEEYDEYEELYFDVQEFIDICNAMSELTDDEIDQQKKRKREFVFHSDLDVESYWQNRTADNFEGLKDELVFY